MSKLAAKNKHAVALGRLGGKAKSPAKAEAARANGGKRCRKAKAVAAAAVATDMEAMI